MLFVEATFALTLLCMGLALPLSYADVVARERSQGTILVLFSQPVRDFSIVAGKFAAALLGALVFSSASTLLLGVLHPGIWLLAGLESEAHCWALSS